MRLCHPLREQTLNVPGAEGQQVTGKGSPCGARTRFLSRPDAPAALGYPPHLAPSTRQAASSSWTPYS